MFMQHRKVSMCNKCTGCVLLQEVWIGSGLISDTSNMSGVQIEFGGFLYIPLQQECIMRRGGRGEERDTTTHFIKILVFTHASRVTKFSTYIFKMKAEKHGVSTCTAR